MREGGSGTDGSADPGTAVDARVRVRGIYTTAVTQRLLEAGHTVVQASEPIRARFETDFPTAPADVRIETTRDRQGLEVSGDPDCVDCVLEHLDSLALDTFGWADSVPRGAVFDGAVHEADGGRGAPVSLGDGRRGYLTYDDVDGYVDAGDCYRLQVREPTPPWDDDAPRLTPGLTVEGGLCTLSRKRNGVGADFDGARAEELVGMTDLLSIAIPEGWGLRWHRSAVDADLEAMTAALENAVSRAQTLESRLEEVPEEPGDPARLADPQATAWLWFGRESRFALDEVRRTAETTMVGHHRIKAGDRSASAAVDFAEAVASPTGEEAFPFAAVSRQFGPTTGDRLALGHGKPDGRLITLGTGEVTDWSEDGSLTLERAMRGGGIYDALEVPIQDGDVAITKLKEGRWWYPTTYKGADGTTKGTYVNVCTPVELFSHSARYVDLHVDVIRRADGSVSVVDEDELEAAVADGQISSELAEKARSVAAAVERALS
ncbi:DUF402 domain-containing protein [Natronosalvus halobius]|uniref:DUF402 domain-containing protein n=1 Tax=Natronosalvus halobius TaxID=2953746 RepID=UPI00209E89DA|nr:DUF402 domain-containing protein [Natronosalvus halobius]USZ70607.1 DUF402 domain-containing protein [Natronosalvus halobius]